MKQFYRFLFLLLLFTVGLSVISKAASEDENRVDLIGKVVDHYYLDFKPLGTVELPRLIYDKGEFYFFKSTTSLLNSSERFTDEAYVDSEPTVENGVIKPETYHIVRSDGSSPRFDFSITSHLIYFWLAAFLTIFIFVPLAFKYRKGTGRHTEPKGAFQNIFETLVVFIRDDIALQNIGNQKYLKFTPYLLTVFFFILFMNIFGLMPWGVSSTADITVTAALALFTFAITQLFATKDHWKHVFWFPGVPVLIKFMLMPVEFIGLFTKPFALCIRLFANIASGKILIFSLLGTVFIFSDLFGPGVAYGTSWIWVLLALFVYLIKALVAFIQAYVFTILSSLFIGLTVAEPNEDGTH